MFITFEGGEGSGKTVQARRLQRKLARLEIPSVLLHEPGGTRLGARIARWLQWKAAEDTSPLTELLLFNASRAQLVEQVIRPTGLLDPPIEVRKTGGQIDDLIREVRERARRKERILVTTLTKRMSEELCRYLEEYDLRVKYLHSEIKTLERVQILRALRLREFDCLVGINLLREGLDLPEVSLVAILDADKEGFLRSEVSLIQTAGRAARHIRGQVIFYADHVTRSMRRAIDETDRRRRLQFEFNKANGITPRGIRKAVQEGLVETQEAQEMVRGLVEEDPERADLRLVESELEQEMFDAAKRLDFERAARLRDELARLRKTGKIRALPRKALRRR